MIATVIVLGTTLGVTLVSLVLHEIMHGLVAYWLGDDTAKREGRLTLNPAPHIDPYLTIVLPAIAILATTSGMPMPIFGGAKPVPINTKRLKGGDWGAALVALAGPLTNLVLAFICFIIPRCLRINQASLAGQLIGQAEVINLSLFAFNLLPIPPLDGSRLLYAFAPPGARRVMDKIERYGVAVVFLVVLLAGTIVSGLVINIARGAEGCFTVVAKWFGL